MTTSIEWGLEKGTVVGVATVPSALPLGTYHTRNHSVLEGSVVERNVIWSL